MRLEVQVDSELPAVRLSQPLFSMAFAQLINNSLKFSKNRSDLVTVSVRSTGDSIAIALVDHGLGIPQEQIPHLFERFEQIDRHTYEQQGSGTGLAIARELIRLHGGDIQVKSVLGTGSTFTIQLPAFIDKM